MNNQVGGKMQMQGGDGVLACALAQNIHSLILGKYTFPMLLLVRKKLKDKIERSSMNKRTNITH